MMAVHSSVGKCYFFVLALVVFVSSQALASAYQVVHPSEYVYKSNSVTRNEEGEANCRRYPPTSGDGLIHYTHCDGTQLRLSDSKLGSVQYNSSDYYVWNTVSNIGRLLFIFPTRVNLTTITLHYYSDNTRGRPRLRFFAVPDDFDVWNALLGSYSLVEIAAVPPGGEPAGRRNFSVNLDFVNAKKILMYKFSSSFILAVSEVEFFTCVINGQDEPTSLPAIPTTTANTANNDSNFKTVVPHSATDQFDEITTTTKPQTSPASTTTTGLNKPIQNQRESTCSIFQEEAILARALFGVVTVLFIVSLTVNVIMVALWIYKKREVKGQTVRPSEFEIEGNPCYEATQMKQTTETETHVYETVQGKRGK